LRAAEAVSGVPFSSLYESFAATDPKSNVSPAPRASEAYGALRQQLNQHLDALSS
jgi:hypothetical protein